MSEYLCLISFLVGTASTQSDDEYVSTFYRTSISAVDGRLLKTSFNGVNPLDPFGNSTEFYETCIFPISGQYGFIPRVLYYILLVFAVMVRSHEWLAAGALASAMSYAGFAAIHAVMLASTYSFTSPWPTADSPYLLGDINIRAIWCILSAGWFIIVPLLSWSSSLRKLNARPVLVYWSVLLAVGIACIAVRTLRNSDSYYIYWEAAAVICSSLPDDDPLKPPYEHRARPYFTSDLTWNHYNCTTQCGSLQPNLFLRSGTQMVRASQTEFVGVADMPAMNSKVSVTQLSGFVLPFVFLQYIYALWSDKRSPAEARNRVCAFILGREPSTAGTLRRSLAVILAAAVYLQALLILIICPLLFFFNILFNEWANSQSPQEEPINVVGQWSSVVSSGLVVIGVSLAQFHSRDNSLGQGMLSNVKRLFFQRRRDFDHEFSILETKQSQRETGQLQLDKLLARRDFGHSERIQYSRRWFLRRAGQPFLRAIRHCWREWQEFKEWVHHPIDNSVLDRTQVPVGLNLDQLDDSALPMPSNAQYVHLDEMVRSWPPQADKRPETNTVERTFQDW